MKKRRPRNRVGKIAAALTLAFTPAMADQAIAAPQQKHQASDIQFSPIPPLGGVKQVSFLEDNERVNRLLGNRDANGSPAPNLARIATPSVPSAVTGALSAQAKKNARPGVHRLRFVTPQSFEQEMVQRFGSQLEIRTSTDKRYARLNWLVRPQEKCGMLLDRLALDCFFEGKAEQLADWENMMQSIDRLSMDGPAIATATQAASNTNLAKSNMTSKSTNPMLPPGASSSATEVSALSGQSGTSPRDDFSPAGKSRKSMSIQPERIPLVVQTAYRMGVKSVQEVQGEDKIVTKTFPLTQGIEEDLKAQINAKGEIQIQIDRDRNQLMLIGEAEDLERASKVLDMIRKSAKGSIPVVERIVLENQTGTAAAQLIQEAYDTNFQPLQGTASVSALPGDEGVLAIGSESAVESVKMIAKQIDIAKKLPEGEAEFKTYRLKNMSAIDAKERVDQYFGNSTQASRTETQPVANPVVTIADYRSNTLIVKGPARYQVEVVKLLEALDVLSDEEAARDIVRVFQLRNSTATDMANIIGAAINSQQPNAQPPATGLNQSGVGVQNGVGGQQAGQAGQGLQNNNNLGADPNTSNVRAAMLVLKTIGEKAGEEISGGFMFDTKIVADANSNSLIVTAPEKSMPLIAELIRQLDRLPDAETQIKVFKILNGDASLLFTMLQTLFGGGTGQGAQGGGAGGQGQNNVLPIQSASAVDGATLANLRFTVDVRTNSIIATGPVSDLEVVHELIVRLDEDDMQNRRVDVFRLSNAPVQDVADALNAWLVERESQNDFFQTELNRYHRRVIVVPELISNSLLISARPEYFNEIERLIRAFDRRPPMVKVKVMIAEVDLDNLEEFGIELGIQDSLLFDRGLSATNPIGFNFNQGNIGNENVGRETFAGQALSNLGVGRVSSASSVGGLVLQAGNESVSVLMRALADKNCLRVLSKPQLMTIENLQGRVEVGAQVPFVTGTTQNIGGGITSQTDFRQVGVNLGVTPRVSPDGMIVMFVDVTNSSLGSVEAGIPVFVADGQVVNQPQINATTAQTSVMARSGQTVVFSGLIQETKAHGERGVPILKDIPGIGPLFKFEFDTAERRELLIFLTPYLVDSEQTLDQLNQSEMDRMHWCLSDVAEVYGDANYNGFNHTSGNVDVIYPGQDPTGRNPKVMPSDSQGWGPQTNQAIPTGNSVADSPRRQNKRRR